MMQQTGASLAVILAGYQRDEVGLDENAMPLKYTDPDLFRAIVEGVYENQTQIDEVIQNSLKAGWRMDRLDAVTVSIMRAATAELIIHLHLPNAVILSEYVSLAYAYFDDPEPKFINGCLNNIAGQIRPA